jgi:predicted  nucleic acid-binding Zn-ribbon protein
VSQFWHPFSDLKSTHAGDETVIVSGDGYHVFDDRGRRYLDATASVLADEILEALDKLDHVQATIKTAEGNLGKTKDELAKVRKRIDDQQQGLETDLARVQAELDMAENQLDGEFKPNYMRLARSMGEEALAPAEGDCCGGCSQTLTPQTMNTLRLDRPVFCKSCGRLLYLPE